MKISHPKQAFTDMRKHLLPAYYNWLCENGIVPYVTLVIDHPKMDVPPGLPTVNGAVQCRRAPTDDNPEEYELVELRLLTLNLSPEAVSRISFDDEMIHAQMRFHGKATDVFIPLASIIRMCPRDHHEGIGISTIGFPYTNMTGIQGVAMESKAPAPVAAPVKRERPSFLKLAVDNTIPDKEEKKPEVIADGLKKPISAAADLTGHEQPPA